METRAPWLILGIILGGILLLPVLEAQDDAMSWAQDDRRVSFQPTPDGFRFDSVRDSELGNDNLEGTFSITNRRYALTYLDHQAPNMTPLRLAVDFEALVEYQDLDGDKSFDLGDRIVQRIRVADLAIPMATVEPVGDGGQRASYEYRLTPIGSEDPDAAMTISFSTFPRTQTIDGRQIPPTQPHLELRVEHFPFKNVTSHVALETRIIGNLQLEEDPNQFFISSAERRLIYEWPGESWVDGNERPVHVTLLGTGHQTAAPSSQAVVLHSYDRGEDVSYQPVVGVEREESAPQNVIVEFFTQGDWRLYGVGMVAAFALIGATVWRRTSRGA